MRLYYTDREEGVMVHATTIAPPGEESVEEFCAREGLSDYVRQAVDLVPRHFPTAGPVRCEVDYSRETDESWVTVRFEVDGREYQMIEQNPEKPSRWGKLARDGHQVVQVRDVELGKYVAAVVDGKVMEYGRLRPRDGAG